VPVPVAVPVPAPDSRDDATTRAAEEYLMPIRDICTMRGVPRAGSAMQRTTEPDTPRPVRSRPTRWLLAGLGVACVGLGALGVVLPGLPTTVFLLMASWLFARSCPWLEERLLRVPLFRPFLRYLEPGATMPRRAVITTLLVMWTAIAVSTSLLLAGDPRPVIATSVVVAGVAGTYVFLRFARRRQPTAR